MSSDGRTVYLTSLGSRFLWLMDAKDPRQIRHIATQESPHDLAVSPRGGVWITNWGSNVLFFLEPRTAGDPKIYRIATSGKVPHHLTISLDGKEVWVSNHESHDVSVVDATSRKETMKIPAGKRPHHVALSSDGRRAYVANSESNDVTVIDAIGKKVMGRVPVGKHPHGIAAE